MQPTNATVDRRPDWTPAERVPTRVLVEEAVDAGVVGWMVEHAAEDGAVLTGETGLLPGLIAEAQQQLATGAPDRPLHFTVMWNPALAAIAVNSDAACTVAMVRDLCLSVAALCTDIRPRVTLHRAGVPVRKL